MIGIAASPQLDTPCYATTFTSPAELRFRALTWMRARAMPFDVNAALISYLRRLNYASGFPISGGLSQQNSHRSGLYFLQATTAPSGLAGHEARLASTRCPHSDYFARIFSSPRHGYYRTPIYLPARHNMGRRCRKPPRHDSPHKGRAHDKLSKRKRTRDSRDNRCPFASAAQRYRQHHK